MSAAAQPAGPSGEADEAGVPAPLRVAVLGSCMTRDNFNSRFNPAWRTWYRVTADHHMPSLISVVSPPTPLAEGDLDGLAAWDAAKIRIDFAKSFLAAIAAEPPDYLLVDFSGEIRVGALQTGEDRWVTHHGRLRRTPWYEARRARGPLVTLSPLREEAAFLERWKPALVELDEIVRRTAPGATVVLQRRQQSTQLVLPGSRELIDLPSNRAVPRYDTAHETDVWDRLDDHAIRTLGWRSIDLRGREYPTSDAHPWGARYLHYSPDRYPDFLAALHAIHLERTAAAPGPEAASMAAFVAGRALEADPGRPWDDEPGRGDRPPKLRGPKAPAPRPAQGPARRLRGFVGRTARRLAGGRDRRT